jgi:2-desacetyl-2-hydroxyethyl bacteriochlorophyllide A dehydrogenase
MKAMVLKGPAALAMEEVARPSVDGGETLVRVTHSGICGTDLKIYQGDIPVRHPLIMGHEAVGMVVEGGSETGARVIIDPAYCCGRCFHCRVGQTHLCPEGGLLGRDRDGGFAEYAAAPAGNVFPLPDGIAAAEAPLIQVLTTCLHAHRLAEIFPGEAVVVLGLGVTGQLHVQLAKARGAHPVIGITRSAWKRDLAAKLGADITLSLDEHTRQGVLDATEGRGADLVIESVGRIPVLAHAIELARIGGRLMPFGIYTDEQGALSFYDLYFKELKVIFARAGKGEDFPAAIDLVRRGVVRLGPLVSHSLPLGALDEALGLLNAANDRRMKVMLDHG